MKIMPAKKNLNPQFSIGELATQTECQIQTIRYYEQISILPQPARTQGGHRTYSLEHVERLRFVRRSRELGFSLEAVRELLRLADMRENDCAAVDRVASQHLADVHEKIVQLRSLERELKRMVTRCGRGKIADCQIIQSLSH